MMLGAKGILSLSHVWRIPSSKALSCKYERLFALISKYSKKRPGLVCPGRKIIFRGTTCIQSLALHFVSTDILCSCNVELTLKPTWHVRSGLVDQTGYAVWFTARGLLPQFVHKSSHRPLSLCASRGCVLLPVMAFG